MKENKIKVEIGKRFVSNKKWLSDLISSSPELFLEDTLNVGGCYLCSNSGNNARDNEKSERGFYIVITDDMNGKSKFYIGPKCFEYYKNQQDNQ